VSGLDVGGGGATTSAPAPTLSPQPCQPVSSWTLYAGLDDAYGAAVVADAGRAGLLFWSDDLAGPRDLRFTRIDLLAPTTIDTWITLTSTSLITQAGVAVLHGAFHAAWVDEAARVHVGRLGAGALETDVVIAGALGLVSVALGKTAGGKLAVVWNDEQAGALFAATSADGASFGAPVVVSMDGAPFALSVAPAPAGAAVAWSAHYQSPDHSELHFALLGEDGAVVVPDAQLTHHDSRYVYDVGLARAATPTGDRFVIATTDSRVDIGSVPLYSTTVSTAGVPAGMDTRLTHKDEHEALDVAFDGASVGLAYDEYHNPGGSQIFLRQLDASGADLFGPTRVSHATYLEYGCCTDTRAATLATDGDGRQLVIWSEVEARPGDDSAFSLKAALLDCAARE
jgi:hypothetical protein